MAIDGQVYDFSELVRQKHPGGNHLILAATGRDATKEFLKAHTTVILDQAVSQGLVKFLGVFSDET